MFGSDSELAASGLGLKDVVWFLLLATLKASNEIFGRIAFSDVIDDDASWQIWCLRYGVALSSVTLPSTKFKCVLLGTKI